MSKISNVELHIEFKKDLPGKIKMVLDEWKLRWVTVQFGQFTSIEGEVCDREVKMWRRRILWGNGIGEDRIPSVVVEENMWSITAQCNLLFI